MINEKFNKCIEVILKNEGGYQCNPNDRGNWVGNKLVGTKYGIAGRFFPNLDIKNLTVEQAKFIYFEKYWLPMKLDGLIDAEVVLQIFDFGVNAGRWASIRTAQRLAGVVPDGNLGPVSKQAINTYKSVIKGTNSVINGNNSQNSNNSAGNSTLDIEISFLDAFKQAREDYYTKLANDNPKNKVFLKGWIRRIHDTHF